MKKYRFNHETKRLFGALGIDQDRQDEIFQVVKNTIMKELEKGGIKKSVCLEIIFNAVQPRNVIEACVIGMMLYDALTQVDDQLEAIQSAMGMLEDMPINKEHKPHVIN